MQLTRWLKNVNIVDGKKVNIGFRKIRVKENNVLKNLTTSSCFLLFLHFAIKVTCIDVAVMFQQMHPGGKMKRNEVRSGENIKTISIVVLLYPGGQICLDTLQAEGQGSRLEEHLAQRGGIFKPLSYFFHHRHIPDHHHPASQFNPGSLEGRERERFRGGSIPLQWRGTSNDQRQGARDTTAGVKWS